MNKQKWFSMLMDGEEPDTLSINIYDSIGAGDFFSDGYSAKQFIADLTSYPEAKKIELHINSPGGSVFDGFAIANRLKMDARPKTCYVDSYCASIATVIACACDTVIVCQGAAWVMHNPMGGCCGNSDEFAKQIEILKGIENQMAGIYAKRSGKTIEECQSLMDVETWLFGQEIIDAGFADMFTDAMPMAASLNTDWLEHFTSEKSKQLLNKITENKEMKELEEAKAKIAELEAKLAEATAKADGAITAKVAELEAQAKVELEAKAIEAKDALEKAVQAASEADAKAQAAEAKAASEIAAKDAELSVIKAKLEGQEQRTFKPLETATALKGMEAIVAAMKKK